ncbi:MAG: energy transducer TonB [Candidatus Sulfotelmatobacter sp.]
MKRLQKVLAGLVPPLVVIAVLLSGLFAQGTPFPHENTGSSVPSCKEAASVPDPDHRTRPKYPKESLKEGAEGAVELRALVDPDGRTRDLSVVSGEPAFGRPALEAVREWKFHPVLVAGNPVETVYKIRVRFVLILQEAFADWEIESPPQNADAPTSRVATDVKSDTPDGPLYRVSEAERVVAPKAIYSPEPEFSERARIAGEGGTVTISLIVGVDGKPRNLKVECASAPDFAEKAIESVSTWKFEPGTKDGKPVMVQIAVEVQFRLYNHP